MGEANGPIPTVQPIIPRPMWGSYPRSAASNSVAFVSQVSLDCGAVAAYGLMKKTMAVRNCRNVKKRDMKLNDSTPKMRVDPETYEVRADGELMTVEPT